MYAIGVWLWKHPRAIVAGVILLILLAASVAIRIHLWHDNETREALAAETKLRVEIGEKYDALVAQLASAQAAADKAKADKAEAEKAAAKKLAQREKFWRDRYANDPAAKAWATQPVPPGVLDGLRQHP